MKSKHYLSVMMTLMICSPGFANANDTRAEPTAVQLPKNGNTFIHLSNKATAELSQSIKTVSSQHPRFFAAMAELDAARSNLNAADKAIYNPELEFDSENTDINTSYAQISQTIDLLDKRGSRTRVAEANLVKANADFTLAKLALSRDLLTALANDHTDQALAKLATQSLELMREFAEIAKKRHLSGDLNQVELDLAQLAYQESLINQAQALAAASSAREQLRAIYAGLPSKIPALPELLPSAQLPQNQDAFIRSLPVMRAREAQVLADRNTVEIRKSERSWDPSIAIRGGKEDQSSLIGATLSIPLNIRNTYRAEVDMAQQQLIASEQLAQQYFRDQRAKVISTTEQFRLLQETWLTWKESGRTSVNRQLKLIKRLWRSGDMGTAEYLVQLKQAISTQGAGIALRGRLWNSGFNWLYETAQINAWLNINNTDNH